MALPITVQAFVGGYYSPDVTSTPLFATFATPVFHDTWVLATDDSKYSNDINTWSGLLWTALQTLASKGVSWYSTTIDVAIGSNINRPDEKLQFLFVPNQVATPPDIATAITSSVTTALNIDKYNPDVGY